MSLTSKKKTTIRGPKGRALQVEETAGIKDENKYSIMEVHEFINKRRVWYDTRFEMWAGFCGTHRLSDPVMSWLGDFGP